MCSRSGVTATAAISYRALALATDDLERLVTVPVDEVVHGLEAELHGERQLLDLGHEAFLADAGGEGVELLALLALGLVHPQPALHRLGDPLGGQAHLEARAVDHLAALVLAADVGHVGGDGLVADFYRS